MADPQPPEGLQPKISDEMVTAFDRAYDACPDYDDRGHCCTRAGLAAALAGYVLLPSGGEVGEELGVQIAFTDNWADGYFTASLYSPADEVIARENAARHAAMEGRPARVARRMVGPWSPVLSDNSEVPNEAS